MAEKKEELVITSDKLEVVNSEKKVVKTLYYIVFKRGTMEYKMNVGEKSYTQVNKITEEKK